MIQFADKLKKKLKKLYKKRKRTVQEIAEYLRQRSHIDGVQLYMDFPTKYKHWSFLYFITYSMEFKVGNYFGVVYDEHGMKGDTLFPDFFAQYTAQPKEYWTYNAKELLKLLRFFREAYYVRKGRIRNKADKKYYDQMLLVHQYHLLERIDEYEKAAKEKREIGVFEQYRDVLFQQRQKIIQKYFNYPKLSKKKAKAERIRKIDRDSTHTMQSESALSAMLDPRVLMNDRFSFQFREGCRNGDPASSDSYMIIWDHKLRKEHWLYKVITHEMDTDNSVWSGLEQINKDISEWEHKTYLKKPTPAPIVDNDWHDKYEYEKVVDFSGGGFVEDGTDGNFSLGSTQRDTTRSILAGGEAVLTSRCVEAVGKGSSMLGSKIIWSFMRQKEYEAILYERKA